MGYIFTEYFFGVFKVYVSIDALLTNYLKVSLALVSSILPYIVKYSIGYCHFYYQLGYGLVVYIYIYRRRVAKKASNSDSFYGDSMINWILFNLSVFNKLIFNRDFVMYIKTLIMKSYLILNFWIGGSLLNGSNVIKLKHFCRSIKKQNFLHNWTPLFKRTSYIAFFSFLKRFSKRK